MSQGRTSSPAADQAAQQAAQPQQMPGLDLQSMFQQQMQQQGQNRQMQLDQRRRRLQAFGVPADWQGLLAPQQQPQQPAFQGLLQQLQQGPADSTGYGA